LVGGPANELAAKEKVLIREEMISGVQSYVRKIDIKNLDEAVKIGNALEKSTDKKDQLSAKSMVRTCNPLSILSPSSSGEPGDGDWRICNNVLSEK
jgi:hypothetical protein